MSWRERIAARVADWARARAGAEATPLTLLSRRIYILPTRAGVAAAALLFLMLLAGLNYNNSLALLLCFLLTGFVLVSMYDCHRLLCGLVLVRAEAQDTFAHSQGELSLRFDSIDGRARRSLCARCAPALATRFDLPAQGVCLVHLSYQAQARGRQRIDRIELSTSAPLGLFRAWTWLYLPLDALIYPAPLRLRAAPPPNAAPRAGERRRRSSGEDEWAWLRPFRDSDPPRSVAWKAYARGAPLLVAHYDAPAGIRRVLDLAAVRELPIERALSQLADWVLECERLGEPYALELPGHSVAAGHGPAQRRACLTSLALYQA